MRSKRAAYRGCLLGLAVGDAMGYSVDTKTWPQIQEDYGPNGLLGYDLVNGYADISSHTQLTAFTCNGLLLGMTRGQVLGKMAPFVKYAAVGHKEWAIGQRRYDQPHRNYCWVFRVPELRRRHCTDTRMLDTLNRGALGTPEDPRNKYDSAGAIATAVAAGLFADPTRMDQEEIDRLGAETIALTHGSPTAFLAGALLAHIVALCLHHPNAPLKMTINKALDAVQEQFGHQYSQCFDLVRAVRHAMTYADVQNISHVEAMEQIQCNTATQVVAGAVYACLTNSEDFDHAMIAAVNHSGRSAAVGAVAGAILGARMGEESLPEFYIECLEPAELLQELADDLFDGCPMEMGNKLFDLDWDHKYLHGGM